MRTDYYFSHSTERERKKTAVSESEVVANGETSNLTEDSIEPDTRFNYGLDLTNFLSSSAKNVRRYSDDKSRLVLNFSHILSCFFLFFQISVLVKLKL